MTLLVVSRDTNPIALYGLRTKLRREAKSVVATLVRRKINVHMVSGDLTRAVEAVAGQAGIPKVKARYTPSQKRDYVTSLKDQGSIVMFVGDGTNDAVAVAAADVGVSVGSAASASEVTRSSAGVVLISGLEGVLFLLDMSKASFRRMAFNFGWASIYNVGAHSVGIGRHGES